MELRVKLIFLVLFVTLILFSATREAYESCDRPRVLNNFLTPEECQAIIKTASDQGLTRSEVGGTLDSEVSKVRTSWQVYLDHTHPAVDAVVSKAEKYLGKPRTMFEHSLQVARYTKGQKYEAHYDSDEETPYEELRSDTLLIYLNDVEKGGHTSFPEVGIKIKPSTGKAVHWKNIEDGKILPCAYHGAMPVVSGEKWICTVWVNPLHQI